MNIAKKDFERLIDSLCEHNDTIRNYKLLFEMFPEKQTDVIDEISETLVNALSEAKEDIEIVKYLHDTKKSDREALFNFLKTARNDWRKNIKYKGGLSLEMYLQMAKFSFYIGPRPNIVDEDSDSPFVVCDPAFYKPVDKEVLKEIQEKFKGDSFSEFF